MLKKTHLIYILFLVLYNPFYSQSLAAVLPAGTEIKVRMGEPIDSQLRRKGYQFRATVDNVMRIENKVIIKQGAKATGKVTQLTRANKKNPAVIELVLTHLTIKNKRVKVKSYPVGGKGDNVYRTELGTTDLGRDEIMSSTGNIIDNTIPVLTKGNYIELSTGSVVYFILAKDVIY